MVLSCIDDIISCHRPVTPAIMSVPLVPGSPEPSLSCDESISSAGLVSDLSEVFPYPLRPLPYLLMQVVHILEMQLTCLFPVSCLSLRG